MHITAAVTRSPSQMFCVEEVELDAPREDEVLVKIDAVGLCHTDIVVAEGVLPIPMPGVLGHEGAGTVVAVGAKVSKLKKGDRVVMTFNFCGECVQCLKGAPSYCVNFMPLNYAPVRGDGSHTICACGTEAGISGCFFGQSSFASHALGNERNVVKVADDVPLTFLGPLGCGFQTGAGAVMRSLKAEAGSGIIVFGGGPVGLSAVMGARVQGCKTIILVEPMAERRALGLELGATHVIDPKAQDVVGRVREIVPEGVNNAVDTSGAVAAMEAALGCLAMRGTLALIGVPSNPAAALPLNVLAALSNGLTVRAVIEGDSDPHEFIPQLVDLYKAGKFPIDKLVRTYPFAAINQAVDEQKRGLCVKAVLTF